MNTILGRCILEGLILLLFFSGYDSLSFDCSEEVNDDHAIRHITEVERAGTVVASFNNTYGKLEWTVLLNGTQNDYLAQFFKSEQVKIKADTNASTDSGVDSHSRNLILTKVLDLELLAFELADFAAYSDDKGDLAVDIEVKCVGETKQGKTHTFTIEVQAVNEFVPQFIGAPYKVMLSESQNVDTEILTLSSLVADMDSGHTNFTFGISPYKISQFDGSNFVRVTSDGHVILTIPVDYELLPGGRSYMFINVTVKDDGGLTTATSVNITIADANDQGVQFIYPDCARPCTNANYTIYTNESYIGELAVQPVPLLVQDLDSLKEDVIFSLTSSDDQEYFAIDAMSGQLYQTSALINDTYGAIFKLQVRAEEKSMSEHFVQTNISVTILDRLPPTREYAYPKQQSCHRVEILK